jgi:hypothetical protein
MDELQNNYRIEIRKWSKVQWLFIVAINMLLGSALWHMPRPLQVWLIIFILLTFNALLAIFVYQQRQQQPQLIHVSESGAISWWMLLGEHHSYLTSESFIIPFAIHLKCATNEPVSWLTIFHDQIDERDRRRLCRIIYRIKTAPLN